MSTTKKIKIVLTKAGTAYDETKEYRLHDYIIIDNSVMYICRRVDATTMVCVGHPLTDEEWWDKSIDLSEAETKAETAATEASRVNAEITDDTLVVTNRTGEQQTLPLANEETVQQLLSEVDGRISKMWIHVVATADARVKVNGVWVTVPAYTPTILKDCTELNLDSTAKYIVRFDIHYNTIWQPTGWYFHAYGVQLNVAEFNVSGLDVSKMQYLNNFCNGMSRLTSLDCRGWQINSTSIGYMFSNCTSLTSLDVSEWDTSNVTSMRYLLSNDGKLTSLDVSSFDTSNVTDMTNMFYNCSSLTSLDVSGWNTSKVTSFSWIFFGCASLTSLNVSKWNTSEAQSFNRMFEGCSSLTSLNMSSFDTSKVTDMGSMFYGCTSLTNLLFGSKWGTQTSTAANALTLGLSTLGSSKSYKLTDATYTSMLTMYDRASAGLTTMTIKFSTKHNLPDGFAEKMSALGYTIQLV